MSSHWSGHFLSLGLLPLFLKGALSVEKEDRSRATVDDHIRMMRMLRINKTEGDWDQIRIHSSEMWAKKETSMGGIIARQVDHLNLAVIIDGDKMRGLPGGFLPDKHISLKGTRSSVAPIIKGQLRPADEPLPGQDKDEHDTHAQG